MGEESLALFLLSLQEKPNHRVNIIITSTISDIINPNNTSTIINLNTRTVITLNLRIPAQLVVETKRLIPFINQVYKSHFRLS